MDCQERRILVIEDDLANCQMLQMALEVEGYRVACSRGPDALDQVATFAPDLILLDLYLDQGDSTALLGDIRALTASGRLPIILMSAHRSLRAIASKVPVDAVLAKPFDLDELFILVAQWTESVTTPMAELQ